VISDISDLTSFKWATVTVLTPLAIKLDGDTAALAMVPDSLVDPKTLSIGSRVRVELSMRKVVIHGISSGVPLAAAGDMKLTASATIPSDWLVCQGQSLLRSAYPALFTAIGVLHGAADSTHFNVPDMRGRVAVGLDVSQTEFDVLGEKGGEKKHTMTAAENGPHTHGNKDGSMTIAWGGGGGNVNFPVPAQGGAAGGNNMYTYQGVWIGTESSGSGTPHNVLQPYTTLNYIIKI
jgi:microcystin-dependent protein